MPDSDVDIWMARFDDPMRDVVERLRRIILHADDKVRECIKGSTPTFTYKGDLASVHADATRFASVLFHQGALIPGTYPHLIKEAGGGRSLHVVSIVEAEALRDELTAMVRSWIAMRDGR